MINFILNLVGHEKTLLNIGAISLLFYESFTQKKVLFVCWIWFFTSHQQYFSYVGTGLPGPELMCLAQRHNTVRLEPAAPRSRVKHSFTEPLRPPPPNKKKRKKQVSMTWTDHRPTHGIARKRHRTITATWQQNTINVKQPALSSSVRWLQSQYGH